MYVATESNQVSALDAVTGAAVWRVSLGTPVPLSKLPCGNIDPLGVTGTPIVDATSRTLYVAAMTTPDGGTTARHRVFALSVDDGSVKADWPVDVQGTTFGSATFDSKVQNQRGALALIGGRLYVPYGGHYGDCGNYHGWLIGISTANPADRGAWATTAEGGGAWSPSGVASDGSSLFIATGNTFGATTWSGGEAVLRFTTGPVFGGTAADFFAPSDWKNLDSGDVDIGGTGPVLIDLPGATPSALVVALGKNGVLYVLDRSALGGVGGQLSSTLVASNEIINAAVAWTGPAGATVAFKGDGIGCPAGQSGDLTAALIRPSSKPTGAVRWCANQGGLGSPMVSTTDGSASPIVWSLGAEGDLRLHGFDGDTGAVVFAGGGASDKLGPVRRYQTPILAGGKIYVAGDGAVYAFTR
jgi:outer membrane protein assembly factor BamB